jgi:crotonobetainyl-CoA:carnitine CoA-transferase CaiB-like acyl-CoA transferase
MLADLGAEVIRIEPPALRGKTSLVVGQVALSRGKRSMTMDLRSPDANELLRRLVSSVDVVVENAKPGAMGERGFGYAQARSAKRGITWCAIAGFGQSGPYAEHAGHDISYLAHLGLLGRFPPISHGTRDCRLRSKRGRFVRLSASRRHCCGARNPVMENSSISVCRNRRPGF